MKILCCTYRTWADDIYDNIQKLYINDHEFVRVKSKKEFDEINMDNLNPDLILWYGWSWNIPADIYTNYFSVMLHPSKLPKYRGGSPIQNQIINGECISAVTLFKISKNMDAGPIINQSPLYLLGDLDDIFDRIIAIGTSLTIELLENYPDNNLIKQNEQNSTSYTRRTPNQSEIIPSDFEQYTAKELHNKIRALQDPYPNAYIKCKNNEKLYLYKTSHTT